MMQSSEQVWESIIDENYHGLTNGGIFLTHSLRQMENISLYSIQNKKVQNVITITDLIALFYWHWSITTTNLGIST